MVFKTPINESRQIEKRGKVSVVGHLDQHASGPLLEVFVFASRRMLGAPDAQRNFFACAQA